MLRVVVIALMAALAAAGCSRDASSAKGGPGEKAGRDMQNASKGKD